MKRPGMRGCTPVSCGELEGIAPRQGQVPSPCIPCPSSRNWGLGLGGGLIGTLLSSCPTCTPLGAACALEGRRAPWLSPCALPRPLLTRLASSSLHPRHSSPLSTPCSRAFSTDSAFLFSLLSENSGGGSSLTGNNKAFYS